MQERYFKGIVQPLSDPAPEIDQRLAAAFAQAAQEVESQVLNLALNRALEAIFRATDHANKYITETAPFTLAKDSASLPRVGAVLHNLLEALRVAAYLLDPFLPDTSEKIFAMLNLPTEDQTAFSALKDSPAMPRRAKSLGLDNLGWGQAFPSGHQVQKPRPLFPRLS
jgi:methionyl-tRNA synthetase